MGNSAVKQKYETASKTGALKLSDKKLKEFPNSLKPLEDRLRVLDLSRNEFSLLPSSIGNYVNLKQLNLEHNKLVQVAEEIGSLTKLECLNISSNRLSSLPSSIGNLVHLKQIYISENQLTCFPIMLCGLKHLDIIDLSSNKIGEIPDGVEKLHVTELILNQNQVRSISESVAECPYLKTLRLEENCLQLSAIPTVLLTNSKISMLALDGNLFEMKTFMEVEGYDKYMERYTAVKKKMF